MEKLSFCFPSLETLTLQANPVCPWDSERNAAYRRFVLSKLKKLKHLDSKPVSETERKQSHSPPPPNDISPFPPNFTNLPNLSLYGHHLLHNPSHAFTDAPILHSTPPTDFLDPNAAFVLDETDVQDYQDFSHNFRFSPQEFYLDD